jgi:hypothetical protein
MSKATPNVKTADSATAKVPYLRVTTERIDVAVECAGHRWAGISEVPRGGFSDSQIETLKADKRLMVELIERDPPPPPADGVVLSE